MHSIAIVSQPSHYARRRSMGDHVDRRFVPQSARRGKSPDPQGPKDAKTGLSPSALAQPEKIVGSNVAREKSQVSNKGSDLAQFMIKVGVLDSFPNLNSMLQLRMNTDFVSEEADSTAKSEWWK